MQARASKFQFVYLNSGDEGKQLVELTAILQLNAL